MKININDLDTEKVNVNTKNIDRLSTEDMVRIINNEDKKVAIAVEKVIPKICEAIDEIYEKLKNGGRLIYIGAGTSGRLGILDASECKPTYGISCELVQGIIAGGKEAMFSAKEGAEDFEELCVEDLKELGVNYKDAIVGIAASGRTPYVIGGLGYANEVGASTISICCVSKGEISNISKISIEVIVGPEVITGSTRMKSGTAQKMILNMLSTGVMIKLGKVYGNLMVDLKATNKKLIERGKNIIINSTGVDIKTAEEYLKKSDNDVKLAIFMILSKLDIQNSIKILEKNSNNISLALKMLQKI